MNITIHRNYIETVLGKENLEEFLMFVAINRFVLRNIIPWVGVLIASHDEHAGGASLNDGLHQGNSQASIPVHRNTGSYRCPAGRVLS